MVQFNISLQIPIAKFEKRMLRMNLNKLGILSIHPTEFHYNYFLLIKSENISIIFHNFFNITDWTDYLGEMNVKVL